MINQQNLKNDKKYKNSDVQISGGIMKIVLQISRNHIL